MKITKEHFEHMRGAIVETCIRIGVNKLRAHRAALDTLDTVKDPAKRYRWDLARASGLMPFFCDSIYPYADDTHIDTALRRIVEGANHV